MICPYCQKSIKSVYVGSWAHADDEDDDIPGEFNNETGECPECGQDILLSEICPPVDRGDEFYEM